MSHDPLEYEAPKKGRRVYGLVRDLSVASQIAKEAKQFYSAAQNFDRAVTLLEYAKKEKPFLVILDFEKLEAEAFLVLKEMRGNADFKGVPVLGFVTQEKRQVKSEAEKAGCFRVYLKTEFNRELPDLMTRYAL